MLGVFKNNGKKRMLIVDVVYICSATLYYTVLASTLTDNMHILSIS